VRDCLHSVSSLPQPILPIQSRLSALRRSPRLAALGVIWFACWTLAQAVRSRTVEQISGKDWGLITLVTAFTGREIDWGLL
jgi:hypothetical protein